MIYVLFYDYYFKIIHPHFTNVGNVFQSINIIK